MKPMCESQWSWHDFLVKALAAWLSRMWRHVAWEVANECVARRRWSINYSVMCIGDIEYYCDDDVLSIRWHYYYGIEVLEGSGHCWLLKWKLFSIIQWWWLLLKQWCCVWIIVGPVWPQPVWWLHCWCCWFVGGKFPLLTLTLTWHLLLLLTVIHSVLGWRGYYWWRGYWRRKFDLVNSDSGGFY